MNTYIDVTSTYIPTKRLIIRPWENSDLNDLFDYASDDSVGPMAGWTPHKSIEESKKVIKELIGEKRTFAIEHLGKVIGSIGIENYNEDYFTDFSDLYGAEIGCALSRDYWGQGLMPEAINAIIYWLFQEKNLDFIVYSYFSWNKQSARVKDKCGFEYYGTSTWDKNNIKESTIENILTKENWLNQDNYNK